MAVSGLAAVAAPAYAAPTCYELSCNNLEVASTNCKTEAYAIDGTAVKDANGNVLQEADLWFSPSCHAFWGEWTLKTSGGVSVALWGISDLAAGSGYERLL